MWYIRIVLHHMLLFIFFISSRGLNTSGSSLFLGKKKRGGGGGDVKKLLENLNMAVLFGRKESTYLPQKFFVKISNCITRYLISLEFHFSVRLHWKGYFSCQILCNYKKKKVHFLETLWWWDFIWHERRYRNVGVLLLLKIILCNRKLMDL